MRRLFFALTALSLLSIGVATAQDATGRVTGEVTDPSGAVVVGAKITVTEVSTGVTRDTVTGNDGIYQVLQVPIGRYTVAVETPGFRKTLTSQATLRINETLRVDVKLEVGATSDVVSVEADAAGVETINATLGSSVTSRPITEMPLNGRDVLQLALLQPGVIPANAGGTGTFSIAGGRQDSVTYLLDGGVNNNLLDNSVVVDPNPDTIQEFRILTSNYNAEYGRNAGGVVSVVTKSGTNQLHGTAYDYLRNDALNANSFFNNANRLRKEVLKRNQFGGTVGGPVFIPKIINGKDKFFFFFGYQGQRLSALNTTSKVTTFTPAELSGDFSRSQNGGPDTSVAAYLQSHPYFQSNPALAAQGIIDPTRINAVAQNYIKAGLLPTSPSGFLVSQGGATNNYNEYTGKTDYHVTNNDVVAVTLSASLAKTLTPFSSANVPGYPINGSRNRYFGNVTYTKTLSPSMINEFRFTAQRNNGLQADPARKAPVAADLGVGITPDNPTGPPRLSFASGATVGFSPQGPTNLIDNTYTWNDVFTWVKGSHTQKGGFTYTPYQNNTKYDFYVNGTFYYSGTPANGGIGSSNDRADFLLGLPDEYLQYGEAPSNIRSHNVGFFWQDEYRLKRNLTLTLGIRYEYSSPKLDLQGRSFSLALGQQSTRFPNAPLGLLFPGDAKSPQGSNFPDRNDWGPRFGFAYSPGKSGHTSIRGGFGVFYDVLKAEDNLQYNGQAPFFGFADLLFDPVGASTTGTNYYSAPFVAAGQANPFPSRPPAKNIDFDASGFLPFGGSAVYFVDPHLRTPYIYQYNMSVQQEVARNMVAEVAYVGSSSHKLTGLLDTNPFILGTSKRVFNAQSGIQSSSSFSYLDTFANVGSANYNSMQASLTKRPGETRFMGTTYFTLSWTYGHSIDNVSGFRTGSGRVPYYNWNKFRADSDFDLRHYVVFSGGWDLPFDRAWSHGPSRLTKGWTLSPIATYRTGDALDIRGFISRSRTRTGPSGAGDPNLVHPDLIAPVTYYDPHRVNTLNSKTGNFYWNPAAFSSTTLPTDAAALANPALRTYGSLGRNALRGPSKANLDFSVAKNTAITERTNLQFRADFFNILNHTEFKDPSVTFTSGTFGQISTTDDPRIIQLSLRFVF